MKKLKFPFTLVFLVFLCLWSRPLYAQSSKQNAQSSNEIKTVYLTFDDGPTALTPEILDVLKAHHIKATFFIVGKEAVGHEAVLKRIVDEGHSIGLHTYSHNFKIIYKTPEAFLMEMEKTQATINQILGYDLDIKAIRFPGGSAGRLNPSFLKLIETKGYHIFDWNVDLKDGIKGSLPPSAFLSNAKKCTSNGTMRIILAHTNSNNKNTCLALPDIIAYYQNEGYTFKAIDNTTPSYYFKMR